MPTDQIDLAKAKGRTFAGAPPGSGKNFAKLKGALAKRGARNPGALAAYIGRRKYGRKGFARLAHGHSNTSSEAIDLARAYRYRHGWILLDPRAARERRTLRGMENTEIARERSEAAARGVPTRRRVGRTVAGARTQAAGGRMSASELADRGSTSIRGRNASDYQHLAAARLHAAAARQTSGERQAHHLRAAKMHRSIAQRTPGRRTSGELRLRKTAGSQLANARARRSAHAKLTARGVTFSSPATQQAMEFAMATHRPVSSPLDLVIVRGEGGTAVIRHRSGGEEIGRIRREGKDWVATIGDKDSPARTHQRSALADVIGNHNKSALTDRHRPASAGAPLQPAPRQTPLMEHFGVPAVRALATPMGGSSDGPRATSNGSSEPDSDDSTGSNGLNAKGKAIYDKLCSRGFPKARALAFAKRAQNMAARK